MSTINVKTNDHGMQVFGNSTAHEEEDRHLIVKDVVGEVVARFALKDIKAWWTTDD